MTSGKIERDPVARRLGVAALAVAFVALVFAGYAVSLGLEYLEEVETIGRALRNSDTRPAVPINPPPLKLAE